MVLTHPVTCDSISGENTFFNALIDIGNLLWPKFYGAAKALFIPVLMTDLAFLLFTRNEKAIETEKNIIKYTVISMCCLILLNYFFTKTGTANPFLELIKDLESQ